MLGQLGWRDQAGNGTGDWEDCRDVPDLGGEVGVATTEPPPRLSTPRAGGRHPHAQPRNSHCSWMGPSQPPQTPSQAEEGAGKP